MDTYTETFTTEPERPADAFFASPVDEQPGDVQEAAADEQQAAKKKTRKQKASMEDLQKRESVSLSMPAELSQAITIASSLQRIGKGAYVTQILMNNKEIKEYLDIVRRDYAKKHGLSYEE